MHRRAINFTLMMVLVLFAAANAFAANTLTVQNASGDANSPGNVVRIQLSNTDVAAGFQLTLRDTSPNLTPTSVRLGPRLAVGYNLSPNILSGDEVRVVVTSLSGNTIPPGDGTVVEILYTVGNLQIGTNIPLTLSDVVLADTAPQPNALPVNLVDGRFDVVLTPASILSANAVAALVGTNGTIVVSLNNPADNPNRAVAAVEFDLNDNPDYLDFVSMNAVGRAAGFSFDRQNNHFILTYNGAPIPAGSGPIMEIVYRGSRTEPAGPPDVPSLSALPFSNVRIVDVDAREMPQGQHAPGSFLVNRAPVAVNDQANTLEDTPKIIEVLVNDSDPDGHALVISSVTQGTNGGVVINAGQTVTYTPNLNFNGNDSFTYTISDGNGGTATATVNVGVTPVNDVPSFVKGPNQNVLEDAPLQTVPNWATAISRGPANEAGQALNFIVTNNNAALFDVQPAVSPAGQLTYTPAPNANGAAQVTVMVHDDGGTDNGGVNTSPTQIFTITVTPVNDVPSFVKGPDQLLSKNSPQRTIPNWATNISRGPANEAGQTLAFLMENTNNALFAVQPAISPAGTLTFTPAQDATGEATVTVRLQDDGGTDNDGVNTSPLQQFLITIQTGGPPVAVADEAVTLEDTPVVIDVLANDRDPDNDPLVISAVTQGANGAVAITQGKVTYSPKPNFNGIDNFTYTISDVAFTSLGTVRVTVTGVNDNPVITTAVLPNAIQDAIYSFQIAANDADGDPLTYSLTTAPAWLTINAQGLLRGTPRQADIGPNKVVIVSVTDNKSGPVTREYSLTVVGDTTPPVFTLGPVIEGITDSRALIRGATNEPTTWRVEYGTTEALGSFVDDPAPLGPNHAVELSGLTGSTDYFVRVRARDANGNETPSPIRPFRTSGAPDVIAPRFVNLPFVIAKTQTSLTIRWRASEAAKATIRIAPAGTQDFIEVTTAAFREEDQITIDGLPPAPKPVVGNQITSETLLPSTTYQGTVSLIDPSGNGPAKDPADNNPAPVSGTTPAVPDVNPPVITARPTVLGITDIQATIRFGTNEPATTIIRYGTTPSLGSEVQDPALVPNHNYTLTGLTPSTTYYFQVSAVDGSNNQMPFTETASFTTRATPDINPPVYTEGPVVANVTDKTATIRWRTNELSNTTIRYRRVGDADFIEVTQADLRVLHEITLTDLLADTDYEAFVKSTDGSNNPSEERQVTLHTNPTPDTQPPRILAVQVVSRETTQFRVEWVTDEQADSRGLAGLAANDLTIEASDPTAVTRHSLTFTGLAANTTYHFRVYSKDGAGNESVAPPLDRPPLTVRTRAVADVIPPNISELITKLVGEDQAIIGFLTNEPSTARILYSPDRPAVLNGDEAVAEVLEDGEFNTAHLFLLAGLSHGTTYYYRVKATDQANNSTPYTPADPREFTTLAAPDLTPPALGDVAIIEVKPRSAKVAWTTNEVATSLARYGTNPRRLTRVVEDGELVTDHEIEFSNLEPNTTYLFRLQSTDASGNIGRAPAPAAAPLSFTTPVEIVDRDAPLVIEGPFIGYATDNLAIVKWVTDEPADEKVFFRADGDPLYDVVVGPPILRERHTVIISGLILGTAYEFVISSTDAAGNERVIPEDAVITKVAGRYKITRALQVPGGSGRFTTAQAPDTQAPVILSGPTITGQTAAAVTIQWTTDELSTSAVNYGTGGSTNQRQEDGSLVTTHALTLTNLSAATVYSYLVSSTDPSNNGPSQSAQSVVQTAAQADVTPPTISGVAATSSYISNADGTTGTITWTTNEPANSVVAFGTTSALGQTKSVSEAITSHTVTITRMTPGSTYFYRVQSTDQSGNGPTQGSILSFTAANTADTTPPALTAVSTTGTTHNRVSVSWTTNESATSILRVFKTGTTDTVTVGSGVLATSHTLSVADTTKIRPSTGYTLIVESADARNNIGASSTTVTTAAGADVTPPAAPVTVTATAGSEQVLVSWSAVTDADLAGYDLFQDSIQIASGLTTATYTATGLTNGTAYTYKIKAADLAGNRSSFSPSAAATPSAAQAPTKPTPLGTYVNTPPGAGTRTDIVSLKPILIIGNATPVTGRPRPTYTFAVYGDSLLTTLIISVSGITQSDSAGNPTHWQVVNPALPGGIALLDSSRYWWRSRANDTVTDGAWSDKATFFTSSAKPVGVELASFTAADDRGVVTVNWRTFATDGIAGFHVYRSLSAQGTFDRLTASLVTGRQGQYEYRDQAVGVNATYYYQLEAVSTSGTRERFGPIAVRVTPPQAFKLSQNAPNPFNPTTTIRYELPRPGQVRLTVYNLLGQEVITLVDAQQEAGFHTVQWTGLNAARQRVASGVYFYRLTVQGAARTEFTSVKKMLLLK